MAKKVSKASSGKLFSGRSGSSAITSMSSPTGNVAFKKKGASVGERTTVRSGTKDSKTYITLQQLSTGRKSYVRKTK